MSWDQLVGPAVVAAIVSGSITIVGFIITARTSRRLHSEKLEFDRELAERKFEFDRELAERKFKHDQNLHDHKRRVELAEQVVAEFYQAVDVIHAIRNPGAFANEWETRTRDENETDGEAHNKNTYFVPLARIRQNSEFLSGLMAKRYRARAALSDRLDDAYQQIKEVIVSIQVSAGTLMRLSEPRGGDRDRNLNLWERCEHDIWWVQGEDDPLEVKVQAAVATVAEICRPILERE